jgi:hypothetical protein
VTVNGQGGTDRSNGLPSISFHCVYFPKPEKIAKRAEKKSIF